MPLFFVFRAIAVGVVWGVTSVALAQAPAATSAPPAQATPSASQIKATPSVAKAPAAPPIVTVTRVVGEAGPRIVTSREVRIGEAISQVLSLPTTPSPGKKRIVDMSDPTFSSQVLRVLDEWTVYLEAVEIGTKPADKAEVARFQTAVQDYWRGAGDWASLEASSTEIREIIERKLMAESLEKLKSDASLVNITEAEALQYFKKNRLRFGNLPFENFKDNIKAALARSQTERRMTEWRAVLRRKYRVRNFVGA